MRGCKVTVTTCFVLCLQVLPVSSAMIQYEEDTTNFCNPDRGFYTQEGAMSSSELKANRDEKGWSLEMVYFRLDPYKSVDVLPKEVFDNFDYAASEARKAGVKMIPRFIYTWGCSNPPDAPLARILLHIEQLKAPLQSNADVIAHVQAGFIGLWGEWHHYGCTDPNNLDNTNAQKQVLFKLLDVLPPSRCVVVRYPSAMMNILGNTPLGPDSAFSGSHKARTGGLNDSYRFRADDGGTYSTDPRVRETQKKYLSLHNRYVPQSGETCDMTSQYQGCDSALHDFKRMHWDAYNYTCGSYEQYIMEMWKNGGCWGTIEKSLGYRLKMLSCNMQDHVRPGNVFSATVSLVNIGWGKIYNPRGCELVFRNQATKSKFIVPLAIDPRRWCMTDSATIQLQAVIPDGTPDGQYLVYLNLPDTAKSIRNRPEYSIRLANKNVWEDSTGYNSLLHIVTISKTASVLNPVSQRSFAGQSTVRSRRHGASIELSVTTQSASTVVCELFSLSGILMLRRTAIEKDAGRYTVLWNTPLGSEKAYLLRIRLNGIILGSRLMKT